jgi:outer membrane receptor protein involved in Fe transport
MQLSKTILRLLLICAGAHQVSAATLVGYVIDPSGQPISGAQVAAFNSLGIINQQVTGDQGQFEIYISPLYEGVQLRVTAAGFRTATVPMGATRVMLTIAPQSDSVRVVGSALDAPASQQGSSVSVITSRELRERNEPLASDLLREVPGVVLAQSGPRGSLASLFVRGADSKYNLVLMNGIPMNSFYFGGLFDFAHVPSDAIEQIDVARGPQSAVYGSYALGSVINFQTRAPENGPAFDFVAEGGTHAENRFSLSGSGMAWKGGGIAGSLSTLHGNGPVLNSDYRNDNIFLALSHHWHTQSLFAFGDFDSNELGQPGPFGSNPKGYFTGVDLVSRSRNNMSTYGAHYETELFDRLRAEVFTGFCLTNSSYLSPFGFSFNKDLRGYGEGRLTYSVNGHWSMAGGYAFSREEMRNTYVYDSALNNPLFRRDNSGVYWENRITLGRLFINAGLREEIYQTPFLQGNSGGTPPRPDFPQRTDTRLNPKVSGAYSLPSGQHLHASYGSGIRPAGGSDLAFTNNPALKPERSRSYDVGVEQRFWNDRLSLDATWFSSRYSDLIVSLGGSLSALSRFSTDNLANARAQGTELSGQLRPVSWFSLSGSYTWLDTKVLSLDGGSGLVQQYYTLGQPLLRRPKHSGSFVATFHRGRLAANIVGYGRSRTLDFEPSFGASAGIYNNPGYKNVGINLNYRLRGNLTVYANVHNVFNQRYEEIYGYPAPLLNVVAGVKWSLSRAR